MVVDSNRSVGQAQILPLPTIRGEPVILRLEFKERVQRRLTRHLSCRVLEIELLVKIVGIASQHLKAGGKITISRFNRKRHLLVSSLDRRVLSVLSFQSWLWLLVHARGYGLVSDSKLVKHLHCNKY